MKKIILFSVLLFSFGLLSQPTQVKPQYCGTTVSSMGSNIYCDGVSGAIRYKFRVKLSGVVVDSLIRPNNKFRFSWINGEQYNTCYDLEVAWSNDAINYSSYGSSCNVCTPTIPTTRLGNSYCGMEIPSTGTNIYAFTVPGSTQYRFRIMDSNGNIIEDVDSPDRRFRLNEMSSPHPQFGVPYYVTVDTDQGNGFNNVYGDTCMIILPIPTTEIYGYYNYTTQQYVVPADGCTINYFMQDTLFAAAINGAQDYEYRIINGNDTIIDNPLLGSSVIGGNPPAAWHGITLRKFPGRQYGTQYQMSVRVMMNGIWGNWGSKTIINTTPHPYTELRPYYRGIDIAYPSTNLYVNSIIKAEWYTYEVSCNSWTETYEMYGSSKLRLSWLSNSLTPGTVYNIRAKVKLYGQSVYHDYGNSYHVIYEPNPMAPQPPKPKPFNELEVKSYPNPTTDYFYIDIKKDGTEVANSPLKVQITDINGRVIEQYDVSTMDISNNPFGRHLPPGRYNIIIFDPTELKNRNNYKLIQIQKL